jgi:hypothetical protein
VLWPSAGFGSGLRLRVPPSNQIVLPKYPEIPDSSRREGIAARLSVRFYFLGPTFASERVLHRV